MLDRSSKYCPFTNPFRYPANAYTNTRNNNWIWMNYNLSRWCFFFVFFLELFVFLVFAETSCNPCYYFVVSEVSLSVVALLQSQSATTLRLTSIWPPSTVSIHLTPWCQIMFSFSIYLLSGDFFSFLVDPFLVFFNCDQHVLVLATADWLFWWQFTDAVLWKPLCVSCCWFSCSCYWSCSDGEVC